MTGVAEMYVRVMQNMHDRKTEVRFAGRGTEDEGSITSGISSEPLLVCNDDDK